MKNHESKVELKKLLTEFDGLMWHKSWKRNGQIWIRIYQCRENEQKKKQGKTKKETKSFALETKKLIGNSEQFISESN